MKTNEGKNDSSRQASPGVLSFAGTDNPRHRSSGGQRNSVPRKPGIKARMGWQPVGLKGNRLQKRLCWSIFRRFFDQWNNYWPSKSSKSILTHSHFPSILQVRQTAGATDQ